MPGHDGQGEDGLSADSVQAKALAGYAKILAEGLEVELDQETQDAMFDMALVGKPPFEDIETFVTLYPEEDRESIRAVTLAARECEWSRGVFAVEPGDAVMVAKDREFPSSDPSGMSSFDRCRTEDAVRPTVISYEDGLLFVRMPDGAVERVFTYGFKDSGQCATSTFRAHPRQNELMRKGICVDYLAPRTRIFHPDVFEKVLRDERESTQRLSLAAGWMARSRLDLFRRPGEGTNKGTVISKHI